jgi:hypothetical protein
MPNRPLDPLELDYPTRLPMWRAYWPLIPANRPRPPFPNGDTVERVYARSQISAAWFVERLARDFMAGRQPTGMLGEPRLRVVAAASTAREICQIWNVQPRSPEVQALVDRAVGCLRQCFARDMRVFEYDRPGYDEVTRFFLPLLQYASDPSVTPVVLDWDPDYHGVRPDYDAPVDEGEVPPPVVADVAASSPPFLRRVLGPRLWHVLQMTVPVLQGIVLIVLCLAAMAAVIWWRAH